MTGRDAAPPRPSVDVVVPFHGSADALAQTRARLAALRLHPDDRLTIVDNAGATLNDDPDVLVATNVRGSYFARNRGAAQGRGDWIVFLDADVEPVPHLLDAYFDPPPAAATALLSGGIVDEAAGGAPAAVRYAALRRSMSHETTLAHGRWAFAQTANCAVRRSAFEAIGGFEESVRSGGDADLAYRLAAAGWKLERRDAASVVHLNRPTLRALLEQRAKHGSGAAWLASRYPGAFPPRGKLGLLRWAGARWLAASRSALRGRRDEALVAAIDPLAVWAFELGRLLPNRARAPKRHARQPD